MKTKERIWTIPNGLSAYRLLAGPFIIWLALAGRETTFAILICVSLVTDVLDGFLARLLKQETKFGAALDNGADFLTYSAAIIGLFNFKMKMLAPHIWLLYVFISVLLLTVLISLYRFHTMPGLHLHSCIIAAYLQGLFFFLLFCDVFSPALFYVSVGFGVLAYLEKTIILLSIDEIRPGLKGLYWMICKR